MKTFGVLTLAFVALAASAPALAQHEHHAPVASAPAPTPGDSAASPDAMAEAVLRQCRGLFGVRAGCVERALDGVLRRSDVATAMTVLDRVVARDAGLTPQAHSIAHGLGIAAYRSPETVAAIFASCPNTQIAGCYHGVIQGYFLDVARRTGRVTAGDLDALCQPHRAQPPLYFECTHGMGHGLMAAYSHRLPDALAGCDLVYDAAARDSCWGGAFMENIVGALHPAHTAEAHAHTATTTAPATVQDDGHDHDHGVLDEIANGAPETPARPWRKLDRTDLLYPCTAVDAKYHRACYNIQTAAIMAMNGGRVGHTASVCSRAPGEMASVCLRSLGRDLTAYANRNPARTARLCARAGRGEIDCLRGAAFALYDVALRPEESLGLCRAVAGETRKSACYAAVGERARVSISEPAALAQVCASAESAYVATCRAGARLEAASD